MTAHPLPLACRGLPHADGAAGTGALSAVGLAATTTALAAAGHHLVFARTASFAACLVVALVFFAGALLRPRASGSGALLPDLAAMVSAQVAASCWFSFAPGPGLGPGPAGGTLHEGVGGAIHLAMTLVTVCALRAVARSRFRLSGMVQSGLRSLFRRLCALLSARTSTVPAVDPSRFPGGRPADERCRSEVLLTGASGRRGPP
ncbi:hypothetical protein QF032_006537 [Streptomyces achromogenes]|uniref:hypothetical protein n=1 Tax=Streptomyces achromogenes TaxID=67255 RepID=UPI0027882B8B|nr:hypothetical protein [Streptomyces achromogenes]MDQ0834693.1 hypothetical protein [Streptomyces achromogenes]